jgi:hypothetical protein
MPSYFKEGNTPNPNDNEVRSLQKITSLGLLWAQNSGVTPALNYLPGGSTAPRPGDNECLSLQKLNAQVFAIANL